MNKVLAQWNALDPLAAAREVLPCNGSQNWAAALSLQRPFPDTAALFAASDKAWSSLSAADRQEAFDSHPRIGQQHAQTHATAESLQWSAQEQQSVLSEDEAAKLALQQANRRYEEKFGRIFVICASGKTSAEILANIEARMQNDAGAELREAAEQQRQITHLRLRRWLEQK